MSYARDEFINFFEKGNFPYKDNVFKAKEKEESDEDKFYDQSEGNYDVNKEIRIKTSMLRSDLCDFNDVYFVVKGNITVNAPNNAKKKIKKK